SSDAPPALTTEEPATRRQPPYDSGRFVAAGRSGPRHIEEAGSVTRNMPFGAERRAEFLLAPGLDHLNHGSYGATPRAVLAAQDEWRARLEANPSGFFMETLPE